jgi:hypothetical protein
MTTADYPAAQETALRLLAYCQARDWSGHDPYDALNSTLFNRSPLRHSKVARLILTQALKRSPLNLRTVLQVPLTKNPKAIGLFITAAINLARLELLPDDEIIPKLVDDLVALRSGEISYACWGYSFPWQTRGKLVPRGAPNLVCTIFAANALLDAHEYLARDSYLQLAVSAGNYLVEQLYFTDAGSVASFRYPLPDVKARVHNANFLAAALLARLYSLTGDDRFLDTALFAARYSAGRQKSDGSWYYGEASSQAWIDNFHTGFNLCALRDLQRYLQISEFDRCLTTGFEFYRQHFIREDGAVRYFHDRTYPIDIHCVAQTIVTLLEFEDSFGGETRLVDAIYAWTMRNMWNPAGFFYYRVLRTMTIRTVYMRWSEAWMFLALSVILKHSAGRNAPAKEKLVPAALT